MPIMNDAAQNGIRTFSHLIRQGESLSLSDLLTRIQQTYPTTEPHTKEVCQILADMEGTVQRTPSGNLTIEAQPKAQVSYQQLVNVLGPQFKDLAIEHPQDEVDHWINSKLHTLGTCRDYPLDGVDPTTRLVQLRSMSAQQRRETAVIAYALERKRNPAA
ncbi:hypothetical protein [Deinococcus roseus]|uniref:Uncharacterized protein n=1 Tax=Deinococcus roseus TaxID=392414 RepID=A0ABQ2DEZ3_9DEIO|nr:hypothetical protein [Deinococcus roseus]GGJ55720.1 hypothetical protein GCM10008938_47380 [Deinococcus roseus]